MQSTLLKLLILSLLASHSLKAAVNRLHVKKAFQSNNFDRIVSWGEKYPSLFSNSQMAQLLAISFEKLNRTDEAVSACSKAALEYENKYCYKFLRGIRKENPGAYNLGLAKYHFKVGNTKKAFQYFYKVVQSEPANQEARRFLTRIFQYLNNYDLMWEQGQYVTETDFEFNKVWRRLESQIRQLRFSFKNHKGDYGDKDIKSVNLYVLSTKSPRKDAIDFLESTYDKIEERRGNSETLRLKRANLLFAREKYSELKTYLESIKPAIESNVSKLSYQSLVDRLANRLQKPEELQVASRNSSVSSNGGGQSSNVAASPAGGLSESGGFSAEDLKKLRDNFPTKKFNLTPIDAPDIALANANDLSPIHRAVDKIEERLSSNPTEYEQRFLVKEMERLDNELIRRENSEAARNMFLESARGKKIYAKYEELQRSFEARDRQNARQFAGEYDRFMNSVNSAPNKRIKKLRFLGYLDRWYKLSTSDKVNLETQGAINAFRKTAEGRRLAREVLKMGTEMGLKPPNLEMPEEWLQDRELF